MKLNNDQIQYLKEINYTQSTHEVLKAFVNSGYTALHPQWFEDETLLGDAFDSGLIERDENGLFKLSKKAHGILITILELRST